MSNSSNWPDIHEILAKLPPSAQRTGSVDAGEIELDYSAGPAELLYQDQYIVVLRDPVRFPGGKAGTYLRIIEKGSMEQGFAGVVIVPRFQGKFVLLHHFRHATRSWEWEFPRGISDEGASIEENIHRELSSELGAGISSLEPLGCLHCNTGLLALPALSYCAEVYPLEGLFKASDEMEAIDRHLLVDAMEILSMIKMGAVRDGYTLGALMQFQARQNSLGDAPFSGVLHLGGL